MLGKVAEVIQHFSEGVARGTGSKAPPALTTALENIRFEIHLRFIWIQIMNIQNFLPLTEVICRTLHLKVLVSGFHLQV